MGKSRIDKLKYKMQGLLGGFMFKKLFCNHKYVEINRWYETPCINGYIVVKVYKKFQCDICNKIKKEKIETQRFVLTESVEIYSRLLHSFGYENETFYKLK
jgi:hypothetical protein